MHVQCVNVNVGADSDTITTAPRRLHARCHCDCAVVHVHILDGAGGEVALGWRCTRLQYGEKIGVEVTFTKTKKDLSIISRLRSRSLPCIPLMIRYTVVNNNKLIILYRATHSLSTDLLGVCHVVQSWRGGGLSDSTLHAILQILQNAWARTEEDYD